VILARDTADVIDEYLAPLLDPPATRYALSSIELGARATLGLDEENTPGDELTALASITRRRLGGRRW